MKVEVAVLGSPCERKATLSQAVVRLLPCCCLQIPEPAVSVTSLSTALPSASPLQLSSPPAVLRLPSFTFISALSKCRAWRCVFY